MLLAELEAAVVAGKEALVILVVAVAQTEGRSFQAGCKARTLLTQR